MQKKSPKNFRLCYSYEMKNPIEIHISLKKTPNGIPFVKQEDGHSCAAACLATIINIYGIKSADYLSVCEILQPSPETGVENSSLAKAAQSFIPAACAGEGLYEGGVAIANIMQGNEGHYVLFLCREKDQIMYFDPEENELVVKKQDDIRWESCWSKGANGTLKQWSINFPPLPGNSFSYWENLAAGKPAISSRPHGKPSACRPSDPGKPG